MSLTSAIIFCMVLTDAVAMRASRSSNPVVAVLEHTVQWRDDAMDQFDANLDIYDEQARLAAEAGAKLLVTPEYGITGYQGSDRSWWWNYGIDIPEVGALPMGIALCDEPGASVSLVLRRLSCIAKTRELALVASLVDMKDCAEVPEYPGCRSSRDGWLLFNTNVVFDSDGSFLAKYHKTNRWGEAPIDPAATCQAVTFTPKAIGRSFGVFTCADLIHSWPVLHLVSQGVRNFVMPLAWTNEMAQMQPLAWQQSWSRTMGVTLLAANARDEGKETGSGIFSEGNVLGMAYNLSGATDELLLASLPDLPERDPPTVCPPMPILHSWGEPQPWYLTRLHMTPGAHSAEVCSQWQEDGDGLGPLCCHLDYEATSDGKGYILALLDGVDTAPGISPWAAQVCTVLPCAEGEDWDACQTYKTEALAHGASAFGGFASLVLQSNFSSSATLFPQVIAGPGRLLPPSRLEFSPADGHLAFHGPEAAELISFQIYGRLHMRDPSMEYRGCSRFCRGIEEDDEEHEEEDEDDGSWLFDLSED